MNKRALYVAAAGMAAAAVVMQGGVASAADGGGAAPTVTATITASIGSRSITAAAPIVMSSATDATTLTGSLVMTVTEAARSGTNPWSVTATMTDLTNASSDVLAKANMAVSGRSVTQVAGGGTAAAPSGSTPLDGTATLFNNTGQLAATVYTGTYTGNSTWTLSVPNGSKVGVYTGTVTLTLVQ